MANIQANIYKGVITSYTIRVYRGRDSKGKVLAASINYKCDPNLTTRQNRKAAESFAQNFENKIRYGVTTGTKISYREYSEYVLNLKFENKDLKYSTFARYGELNQKIYEVIGHLKLRDITPSDINKCLSIIRKEGKKIELSTASSKINNILKTGEFGNTASDILINAKKQNITVSQNLIHRASGLSQEAVKKIIAGSPVLTASADKFAESLGYKREDLFKTEIITECISEKTLLEYYRLIHSVLEFAVKEGTIEYNSASRAVKPKYTRKNVKPIQPQKIQEVSSLVINTKKFPSHFVLMMIICIYSGARRGEIMALRIDGINFEDNTISINQNLQYHKTKGIYVETPKTEKSKRKIKLPQFVMDMIKEYLDWRVKLKLYCAVKWSQYDLVFINEFGNPYSPDSFSAWVSKVTKGIDIERIHPHRFRHSAASAMISEGVDIATVSMILGHASIEITEDFYIDPLNDAMDKAVNALSNIYGTNNEGNRT